MMITWMQSMYATQTVRSQLAERVGMSSEAGTTDRAKMAEAVVASGRHQELLRSAIASIVGPSSRYVKSFPLNSVSV